MNQIRHCFLDTQVFLHYQLFTEINWSEEIGAVRIVLVVCSTVISELDKHKFSHSSRKIRGRAQKAISKLEESEQNNGIISANVSVSFLSDEPNVNWAAEGLSPDTKDDRIIASILTERDNLDNIILITSDFGLKLKAKSRDIDVHRLSDKLFLPLPKSQEEAEIEKLKKRIITLENRLPKLSLEVIGDECGDNFSKFHIPGAHEPTHLSAEEIEAQLNEMRQRLKYTPPAPKKAENELFAPLLSRSLSTKPDQEEINRYEADVTKYLLRMQKYLHEKQQYEAMRVVPLQFVLVNEGTAPADNIDILLHFPDGFTLFDEDDLPSEPKLPKEPVSPKNPLQKALEAPRILIPSLGLSPAGLQPVESRRLKPTMRV